MNMPWHGKVHVYVRGSLVYTFTGVEPIARNCNASVGRFQVFQKNLHVCNGNYYAYTVQLSCLLDARSRHPDRLKKLMPVDSYGMICLLCYFLDLSQKFFMPSTIRKRLYIDWN